MFVYLFVLFVITTLPSLSFFFFFNDTATTEIYTLSLHDALPIWCGRLSAPTIGASFTVMTIAAISWTRFGQEIAAMVIRSEEHTSELQSLAYLVCRLLLEKKKKSKKIKSITKLRIV